MTLCLYRVIEEALANTVAQAASKGLGLIGMEERVRQVGGTFAIRSALDEGTRIEIEIPPAP